MIYTSYFSSKKYNKEDGVSIARWNKFWQGPVCLDLAPSQELLSWWKNLSEDLQKEEYYQQLYFTRYKMETLDKLNPKLIGDTLQNKVLLCYEKSSDFCHRHIVAAWLRYYGYEAEEL